MICARTAHIAVDECGAPERYLGCKLVPSTSPTASSRPRWSPRTCATSATPPGAGRVVSISQPTELGTLYTRDELRALVATAREHGLALHVDGARLPMAAAALGCSLAEAAGAPDVDVVSFGGTKCGALGAEAVVVYREGLADSLAVPAQAGDAAREQAALRGRPAASRCSRTICGASSRPTANAMAQRIADGSRRMPGVEVALPVETNAVFARLSRRGA